jgi:chromosome partitioning protein
MVTFSFLNLKGGVGKTTCSVNLAAAVARLGSDSILVDLDPQASATDHMIEASDSPGVAGLLMGSAEVKDSVVEILNPAEGAGRFALIPSGGFQLSAAEVALQARGSKNRLRVVLNDNVAMEGVDLVFVDTGPGLDFLWYNALYASDIVLCPVELQMAALQGLRRFHELLQFADEEDALKPHVYYIPTNNDGRLTESRELLSVLLDQYGSYPEGQVLPSIRYSSSFSKAYAQRQTVFEFSPRGRAALDCERLAEIILSLKS